MQDIQVDDAEDDGLNVAGQAWHWNRYDCETHDDREVIEKVPEYCQKELSAFIERGEILTKRCL